MALQVDGKPVVAGRAATSGGADPDFAVVRFLDSGTFDSCFGSGVIVHVDVATGGWDEAFDLAIEGDGRIVVAGFALSGGKDVFALLRLKTDGTRDSAPDTTFGCAGLL